MEMEDHNHHQYSMPDLRQLLDGKPTQFQAIPQAATDNLFPAGHRNLQPPHHHPFDMNMMQMMGMGIQVAAGLNYHDHHHFPNTENAPAVAAGVGAPSSAASCGFDGELGTAGFGVDGGTGRWPRQETLTLLEIRSRLDLNFKEANQKGPLWDEVSRIMCEEHGYQRSGKKCREKFENLYKYYKKTKEGKAGRQDGKHYRFFRQLEALCGESSTSNINNIAVSSAQVGNNFRFPNQKEIYRSQKLCDSLSLSNSFQFDTTSSDDNDLSTAAAAAIENINDSSKSLKKKRGSSSGRRSWKGKIKEFIDSQMRKLIERQEVWLEKLTKTLEQKEQERVLREEEWRKEEAARIDKEHEFWAKERAWIEARDAALMEAMHTLTGKQLRKDIHTDDKWEESEVCRLIQLRTNMGSRFEQAAGGYSEDILWEEIASNIACLGFEKSASMCKDKWDRLGTNYLMKTNNKKRKDDDNSCGYNYGQYLGPHHQSTTVKVVQAINNVDGSSNSNAAGSGGAVNDSCFRFMMADGDHNLWENYGLKLSKGDQNQ